MKQQLKKRWITNENYGWCRTFTHPFPLPKRKQDRFFVVIKDEAVRETQCPSCGGIKRIRINMSTGKMRNSIQYPKDYLLKRKSKSEKLPSRLELRLEFVSTHLRKEKKNA